MSLRDTTICLVMWEHKNGGYYCEALTSLRDFAMSNDGRPFYYSTSAGNSLVFPIPGCKRVSDLGEYIKDQKAGFSDYLDDVKKVNYKMDFSKYVITVTIKELNLSRNFTGNRTIRDILQWAKAVGLEDPKIGDLIFSDYTGESC